MTTAAPASRSRVAGVLPWLCVVGGLVIVAVLVGAPEQPAGEPFDTSSTSPSGTKALVELIESFDGEVDTASFVPSADTDVALLFTDAFDEGQARSVEGWVDAGGTLVVADPFSRFTPSLGGATGAFGVTPTVERGDCDIDELSDLTVVDPGDAVLYEIEAGRPSCFGDRTEALTAVERRGNGRIVSVGGGQLFTNDRLVDADNAAFASRLLVPRPATEVAILQAGSAEESGDRSLTEVMALGVRLGLVQLVVAFAVYAWFRARRLGAPVIEAQPVDIAASELVLAVGQLLHQTKNPSRAATLLRADLRRRVAERFGLPATMATDTMADVVAARTTLDPQRTRAAMIDSPVATDAELLDLAQTIDAIQQEILHDH